METTEQISEGSDTTDDVKDSAGEFLDIDLLKRRSLQRCTIKFIALLEPDQVLDIFEEEDIFSPITKIVIRDIRELHNTSNKNRSIINKIGNDPSRYGNLKEALARTGQYQLVEALQDTEVSVHDEMKDLQQYLIQLYLDQCTRVPLYPLDPDVMERVDRMFVRPEMRTNNNYGQTVDTSIYLQRESDGDIVENYRDVFYNENKRCRNIYITGEAGVGKTTLCESIVLAWCNAHLNKDCSEDGENIAAFSVLFYIALRNCSGDTNIEQMIEHQLEVDNVSEILEKENCLIILDGLDEWEANESDQPSRFVTKGLPGRKIKGNFTILTTTRPWKLEVLRLKATEIDRHVSITGFSDKSLEALETSVINILNEKYSQDKQVDDFHKEVEKSKLKELTQIPMMLLQILCLWHGNIAIGDSQRDVYSSMIDKQLEFADQVKHVQQAEIGDSVVTLDLPDCLKGKAWCKRYRDVLLSLSQLAYQLLCNQSKEASLVFSHKQTEIHGMTEKQLQFCLKVGLLTQHKTFGKVTEKLKTISFIHKTYQEFFAAVFLSAHTTWSEVKESLSKIVYNLDSFLEMAKICVFVCGMKPGISDEMFNYIMEVNGDDDRIQRYRAYWYDIDSEYFQLTNRIQQMAFEVLKEMKQFENKMTCLRIDDLIIRKENVAEFLTFGKQINTSELKSIYLNSATFMSHEIESIQEIQTITENVAHSNSLRKVCLIDSKGYIDIETLCKSCCEAKDSLKCLGLISVNIIDLGLRFADMLQMPLLVSLVLRDINLTQQQIGVLANAFRELSVLKQLNLSNVKCITHTNGECDFVLDLSSLKLLESLFMYHLNVKDMLIDPSQLTDCSVIDFPATHFLRKLKGAVKLRKFICLGFQYSVCAEALVDILPSLQNANSIDIRTVDFGDMNLRVSPNMANLKLISLSDVTITDTGLRHFVDSLPANGVHVHLHLTIDASEAEASTPDYIKESPKFIVTRSFDDPCNSTALFVEFCTVTTDNSPADKE